MCLEEIKEQLSVTSHKEEEEEEGLTGEELERASGTQSPPPVMSGRNTNPFLEAAAHPKQPASYVPQGTPGRS